MQNRAYNKSIIREIASSKGRFISILLIILMGVSFFAGIKSSAPDMNYSINKFYNEQKLMDSKIVSSLGLTDKDLELLRNNDKISSYSASKSIDVNLTNLNSVVKFIDNNNNINKLVIVDGRLPQKSGEIALDEQVLKNNSNLKIGDTYTIKLDKDSKENFKTTSFKIVGFVKSPMYIENSSRGNTNIGKGSIDYFAIVDKDDLSMDVYTEIYVRFKNVENIDTYSKEYESKMEENTKYLKTLYKNRSIDRIDEIKSEALKEINKAEKELEDGEKELLKAQNKVEDGKKQLLQGKKDYENGLKSFNEEIKNGEEELVKGQSEINKQLEIIKASEEELNKVKEELDKARDEFVSSGINPDIELNSYESQVENLKTLVSTYNFISNDIKSTVNNLTEGENIPNDKIVSWKNTISNESLGLTGLNNLISSLENNPSNKELALNIASKIDIINSTTNNVLTSLETLVSGISQYQSGKAQYEEGLKAIKSGKTQLENAQKELDAGKEALEQGKIEGKKELENAKKQLDDSENQLEDAQKEIDTNKQKLRDGREELNKEKEKLNELDESEYYFFDRTDNPGYSSYKYSLTSIENISSVFPVFFFLIAVLICLTTMTRMVEENRGEIGTLKALGYSNYEISKKFIIYSSIASISGCVLGILIGVNVFPFVINYAYQMLFMLPKLYIRYYPSYIIQSIIAAIVCTVGASVFVLMEELKGKPTDLMKVKAPKSGKKILLERITPLWKRLSFNQKVTLRNLFRYKQRMFMTVFGIAGCMAMLVTGFGLKSSSDGVVTRQFGDIYKYQGIVVFDTNSTKEENEEYESILKGINGYEGSLDIHQESVTFKKDNMNKQAATLYVPKSNEDLNNYIVLQDRKTKRQYNLSDDGVIITEKLAKLLQASKGDSITLSDDNNNLHTLKVSNITESYLGHSIYMSSNYYKKVFNKDVDYNANLLKLSDNINEDEVSTKLMDCKNVINVTFTSTIKKSSEDSTSNLGLVMLVIIIASGGLAFIVLYNLTNINVSERIRELSTIKVLGFYDNEVTMYIVRENIILTLLGILTGSAMGQMLYRFITKTAETDIMMMIPEVYMDSYIYSGLMTFLFSAIVMLIMHKKLKNVNMIDALKSNE